MLTDLTLEVRASQEACLDEHPCEVCPVCGKPTEWESLDLVWLWTLSLAGGAAFRTASHPPPADLSSWHDF